MTHPLRIAGAAQLKPLTLEQLIEQAESLGRLRIEDKNWAGFDKPIFYEAEIFFRNRSGSSIHARGEGPTIKDALVEAIAEAERLR